MYRILFVTIFASLSALNAQTVLQSGDLALVSLGAIIGSIDGDCLQESNTGSVPGRDRISFITFKDIAPGTNIDITDNGWEREFPGLWGNTEGFVRITRTLDTIRAGTVITFELPTMINDPYEAVSPDQNWTFESLGTNALNFNDSGDQIYFLQGGFWNNGTIQGCCNGNQDASYEGGRILFAFNSKTEWISLGMDSQESGLHPDVSACFNMAPTINITPFASYAGPVTEASQLEWIQRISDPTNWAAFPDCQSFIDAGLFTSIPIQTNNMSIACTVCQGCDSIEETLSFSLPLTGGPFTIDYTNGLDTFRLTNVEDGATDTRTISTTTTFELTQVTGIDGCPVFSNFDQPTTTVSISNNLTINRLREQSALCTGVNSGLIEVEVQNGIPPYIIDWNLDSLDGLTLATDLAAGEYIVEVIDSIGCMVNDTILLVQTIPLSLNCETSQEVTPGDNNGEIMIQVNGGSMPYNLNWAGPNNTSGVMRDNVDNPIGISGLSEGTYDFTITDSNGCSATCSNTLGAVNCTLEITNMLPTNPTCGGQDGSIQVEIMGANGLNIMYDWGNINIDGQENPMNLGAGLYKVTITDSANCMAEDSVLLTTNTPPLIACTVVNNVTTVGGNEGSLNITVQSNDNPPYKVVWNNATTGMLDSLENLTLNSFDIPNLTAGIYEFTLTDANGCSAICNSEILDVVNCNLELDLIIDRPNTCNEPEGGRLEARFTGATGRVSNFDWNLDQFDGQSQVAGLGEGTYILTITDDAGCMDSDTVQFGSFVPLSIDCQVIDQPDIGGSNGVAQLEIIGGTASFEINLTGPTTQNLFSDGTSLIRFSDLQEGVYTVTVLDEAGCLQECMFALGPQNCTLQLSFETVNPDCFDPSSGIIKPIVRGAKGQVFYDWSINDFDGLDSLSGLSAGTYILTVIDTTNCLLTDSVTLAVDSDIVIACETIRDETRNNAFDGTAQVTVTGGQTPFQIEWEGPDNMRGSLTDVDMGIIFIEDLMAGLYDLTITDANGCSAPCSFTIRRDEISTCALSVQLNAIPPSCSDPNSGIVNSRVSGATGAITYDWNQDIYDGLDSLMGVPVGMYELVVMDESNCTDTALVEVNASRDLVFETEIVQPPTCLNMGGEIAITQISGGEAPFFASLNGSTPQTVETFPFSYTGLDEGVYSLILTDNSSCSDSITATIDESSPPLTLSLGPDFSIKAGEEVILQGIPNFSPTSLTWVASDSTTKLPDSLTILVKPAETTLFTLTVFDRFGCFAMDEVLVNVDSKTKIYAPNAFTPNGDGINDRFSLYGGLNIEIVKSLMVFDRWGDLIFQAEDFPPDDRFGWDGNFFDGRKAVEGTYIYWAKVERTDGTETLIKGEINLIR